MRYHEIEPDAAVGSFVRCEVDRRYLSQKDPVPSRPKIRTMCLL